MREVQNVQGITTPGTLEGPKNKRKADIFAAIPSTKLIMFSEEIKQVLRPTKNMIRPLHHLT